MSMYITNLRNSQPPSRGHTTRVGKQMSTPNPPLRGALCLDLDGTLLNSSHSVSEANSAAVARASRAGYAICLCTGRSLNCRLPSAHELGIAELYLVGCNGAVVCRLAEDGSVAETIFETQLSHANIDRIALALGAGRAQKADVGSRQYYRVEAADEVQSALVAAHNAIEQTTPTDLGSDYVAALKRLDRAPNKMTVFDPDAQKLREEAAALGALENIEVVMGGPNWADTVDTAHDKAAGIRLLCERLGISIASCVAFGDGANDASMLATCGLGIAMAQGRDEAKEAADRVSAWTNDEDAVAREIDLLLASD